MDAHDARTAHNKIDTNPSLYDAQREYDKLYVLADKVIYALAECEEARDEANERIKELEEELAAATENSP